MRNQNMMPLAYENLNQNLARTSENQTINQELKLSLEMKKEIFN